MQRLSTLGHRRIVARVLVGALFPFMAAPGFSQSEVAPCAANAPEYLEHIHHNDPQRIAEMEATSAELEDFTREFAEAGRGGGGDEIVIPVVFHVIHLNGPENVSDEQIHDAMRVLNDDFNKLNTDWDNVRPEFLDIVADVGISFRLAGLDPDGNCTKGITRTISALTNDGDQDMKDLIQWPRNRYMNVWICAYANGAAGYTLYPSAVNGPGGASTDGIVVQHNYLGTIGTGSPSRSRTLTHEVGHWLNLRHAWGDSNDPGVASNCNMDDGVADTPNSIGWTTCNLSGESCNAGLNNVENYMEYSYCSKMFTNGQKTRMLAAVNSGTANRNNLWTQGNRQLTGTWDDPVLCAAEFTSDLRMTCVGGTITFEDRSFNNVTSWNWTFEGGTPSTSTEENPVVTYPEVGTYAVGLEVGDGVNTVTASVTDYVTVLSDPGLMLPFTDDFESTTSLPNSRWTTVDTNEDGTFALNTSAAYSGTKSIRLQNYGIPAGSVDELITTSLDLSGLTEPPVLSFRYAYRQRNSANDDELRIYISRDCGATWNLRAILDGNNTLATTTPGSAFFQPTNPAQWGYREITNITAAYLESDVRFKFWFQSDGGNNFWLDDVNINGTGVGFEEVSGLDELELVVLPNPVADNATVQVSIPRNGQVSADIIDPLGRTVSVVRQGMQAMGNHRWELPQAGLMSGVYFVRVQYEGGVHVTRFIKQ